MTSKTLMQWARHDPRHLPEDELADCVAAVDHLLTYPGPVFAAAEKHLLAGWQTHSLLTVDMLHMSDEAARNRVCYDLLPDRYVLGEEWSEEQWRTFARSHDELRRRQIEMLTVRAFLAAGHSARIAVLASLAGLGADEASQPLEENGLRTILALRDPYGR